MGIGLYSVTIYITFDERKSNHGEMLKRVMIGERSHRNP